MTPSFQDQYDDAMFEFSLGNTDAAIEMLERILAADPSNFDAQLALGGAYHNKGEYARAIEEGHKAEKLRPHDQLAHTSLSRAYMKSGDKTKAEHHGLQSRIASWRGDMSKPDPNAKPGDDELKMAAPPPPPPVKLPEKFPDMPWKKKPPIG